MAERRLRAVPSSTPAKTRRPRARAQKPPEGPPEELLRLAGESAKHVNLGGIYAPIDASRAEAAGALISPEPSSPKPVVPPAPKPPLPLKHRRLLRILELRFWPMTNLRRTWRILIALSMGFVLVSGSIYFGPVRLNPVAQLQTAILTDIDGQHLGEIRPEQNRVILDLCTAKKSERCIPKILQKAFVAAEDERFWSHPGVDPIAIVRAMGANARGDREGASTITQQYVKNTFTGSRRTMWRKLREAILAIRVDRKWPKETILEEYLNSIYLGNGAYGVEAASRLYFGHSVTDAKFTLGEAAMIAGITANPTRWDPRSRREASRGRRDHILSRMRTLKLISTSEAAAALAETPDIKPKPKGQKVDAPGFQDWLRGQFLNPSSPSYIGDKMLYTRGLAVTTSLDLKIQKEAEKAVADILNRPGDPEAAVVTIDVATGGVRAMVGGRNARLGEFNLATQARRQSGSAFKPFVLAAALEQGKTLGSTYRAPGTIRLKIPGGGVWKVSNFDRRGRGRLPLRAATAGSVNTVFAQLILDVGSDEVVDLAHRAGITSRLSAVPSLTLGTSGVSALEMAAGYATFAREGRRLRPIGITTVHDRRGELIAGAERQGSEAMTPEVAEDVLTALRSVVRSGTGRPARLTGYTAWGKTGTTEDHADAWFVGGAGGFVTAVWVGHPSGRKPMTNVHGIEVVGSSFPAQIWKRVMTATLDKYKPADDTLPKDPAKAKASAEPVPTELPSEEPSEEPTPSPIPSRGPIILPTLFPQPPNE